MVGLVRDVCKLGTKVLVVLAGLAWLLEFESCWIEAYVDRDVSFSSSLDLWAGLLTRGLGLVSK